VPPTTAESLRSAHPTPPATAQDGRRIVGNTAALAGSNLWRILISFVLQLLIFRQLGTAALGVYSLALAYLNLCQTMTDLGLPGLLVRELAQAPHLRRSYFRLALSRQLAAAVIIAGGLGFTTTVAPFSPELRGALWCIGASLPWYAVTSATQTLFQAGERMELVMGVELCINTLILLLSIGVLWVGGGVVMVVAVIIGTQVISAGLGLWLIRRSGLLAAPQLPLPTDGRPLWRRLAPFYTLSLADVLMQRVDLLLLSFLANEAIVGIYSAAYNLVRVLLKLIQSFLQALYPTLSRLRLRAPIRYRQMADLSLRAGLLLLLPALLIGGFAAEGALRLVYGSVDPVTVLVLRVLLITGITALVMGFVNLLFLVEQRPRWSVVNTAVNVAVVALLLPLLEGRSGASGAAYAVAGAGGVSAISALALAGRRSLPIAWRSLALILGGGLVALTLAVLSPGAWPVQAAVAVTAYVLLILAIGLVSPADRALVRATLARPPAS
jgi:O-antigen/teichoic acid export membrane protein